MWKCLHDDPETSKLLKQIYGASLRPEIFYPKVKISPRVNIPRAFTTSMTTKDSTLTREREKEVRVPKFRAAKANGPAPIDFAIMRRKRGSQIHDEQTINEERIHRYRPPYIKPVGEDEKLRLAEKFEFGGGKALPPEMTGPVLPIPSEERWKNSEKKRVAGVIRRRKGLPDVDPAASGEDKDCYRERGKATTMFDQVADEIEERQRFLLEARASNVPYEHEARVMAEISQRMSELKRLAHSPDAVNTTAKYEGGASP